MQFNHFDVFRITWTRISAPGPVSMNGSPADGSLLVRTHSSERLILLNGEMSGCMVQGEESSG